MKRKTKKKQVDEPKVIRIIYKIDASEIEKTLKRLSKIKVGLTGI